MVGKRSVLSHRRRIGRRKKRKPLAVDISEDIQEKLFQGTCNYRCRRVRVLTLLTLTNNKVLDQPKSKAYADNKISVIQN